MSIEQTICTLIAGNAALAALVDDRVFPLYRPQGESRDCIVYQRIGGADGLTTDGPLGLIDARFQFNCFSASHAGCVVLAEALMDLLEDCDGSYAGVTIQSTQVTGPIDVPALDEQSEQLSRYGRLVDCTISFNES